MLQEYLIFLGTVRQNLNLLEIGKCTKLKKNNGYYKEQHLKLNWNYLKTQETSLKVKLKKSIRQERLKLDKYVS